MPYKVRLTGSRQRMYAHQLIDAAPEQSTVTIVGGDRTIDQNAKMWAMLTDVVLSSLCRVSRLEATLAFC